jgi:hypothetical protein
VFPNIPRPRRFSFPTSLPRPLPGAQVPSGLRVTSAAGQPERRGPDTRALARATHQESELPESLEPESLDPELDGADALAAASPESPPPDTAVSVAASAVAGGPVSCVATMATRPPGAFVAAIAIDRDRDSPMPKA